MEECTCIPEGAVVLNTLTIVEYLADDGTIYKADFSHDSSGEDLELGKVLELCAWAQMIYQAPIMAGLLFDEEDE